MNFMLYQHVFLVLLILLKVLAHTTEKSNLYKDLDTTNYFENDSSEEYQTTIANDYNVSNIYPLNIVSVSPNEVVIDTTSELQLSIANYTRSNASPILCFANTPDNDLEILSSNWVSETHLNCTGFSPLVPGLFFITVSSTDGHVTFDKKQIVKVTSKHPVAERAEYSYNLDEIFIHFDANIELKSNCASTFSEKTLECFGGGFSCAIMGKTLVIKMGVDFKLTTEVEISTKNKICRSGSGEEFCLYAKPGNVKVREIKVSAPILSLLTTSECAGNTSQKYLNLKVTSNNQNQKTPGKISLSSNPGKNQRKNLMIWRTMRRIQNKFSSNLTFKIDKSDIQLFFENLASVENFLSDGNMQLGPLRTEVTVSVLIQSPHFAGNILAEANVVFCKNFNQLFRYKWTVNEKTIAEEDKLLIVQDATPGKYVIKCYILAYNSSEVLGQGWTTTEIFDSRPQVMVYPVEIVTATTENIFLHAVVWHGETISWACKTNTGEVCITNSRQLINDCVDMNSYNITIPAQILPVGEYIWTIENTQGVNTAKIIIKLENSVAINVKLDSVFVGQFQNINLTGVMKRPQNKCRLWWSSVRQKGFNYINLEKIRSEEILVQDGQIERQIDLEFPRFLRNWKGLEPNSLYMFKLSAFCAHSVSYEYMKIPISVNNPPRVSSINVQPRKGLAMATNFIISKVEADDYVEDYPLLFEWSYLDTCGVEIPITKGAYSRQITTFLPPGDIKVILTVCDAKGACSKVSSSIIDVGHSKIIPENFQNAAKQIYYLIVSRNDLEAFGLAVTAFKSLALKAETEIRHEVFSSVEEGIYTRIKLFNESIDASLKNVKSCLGFVDRALTVAKYFPKASGVSKFLTDFKSIILKKYSKKEKISKNSC